MSTVEKAYDYYHKIVNLKKDAKTDKLTLINIKDMIETLSSVIDNGNDYLLTNATMYFIASQDNSDTMINLIKSLNNKEESINFIHEFINHIHLHLYVYYFKYFYYTYFVLYLYILSIDYALKSY